MSNLATTTTTAALSTYGTGSAPSGNAGSIAWVKFLSNKAKGGVLEKTQPACVQTNEFYYEDDLGVVRLNPCRIFVLDLFHHKGLLDEEGKLVSARPNDFDTKGTRYADRTLALVLANHPAGLQPALMVTAKGLCRPWRKAESVIERLKDDAILLATPGYATAANAAAVTGRFVLTLTGGQEKGSAKGAMAYNVGYAAAGAPTEEEVAQFNTFWNSDLRPATFEHFARVVTGIVAKFDE